jgi:hypothetical protein
MTQVRSIYGQLVSAAAALTLSVLLISGTVATPHAAPVATVASEIVA